MSRRWDLQSGEGCMARTTLGELFHVSKSAPTNGQPGFLPGCLWFNYLGAYGAVTYENVGTYLSASWRSLDSPGLVAVAAATTTLTLTNAAHAGRTVVLAPTGGLAITPPAAVGSGMIFTIAFAATLTGGSVTVDPKAANAANVVGGVSASGASGGTSAVFGTAATDNFITFNGTTTGGLKGTTLTMQDVATNVWAAEINNVCSGVAATPFSTH